MDRNLGDGFFEITCVHRDDIKAELNLSDDLISKATDDIMAEIACKMEDDYSNQMFNDSLRIIARKVLKKYGILA